MNTHNMDDKIQGTDSVAILRTTLDDLLLSPEIMQYGVSQGGKINDQLEEGQTESDLRKFVRTELDKMWAGYTRTALNPRGLINLMEGNLPSTIDDLGGRFAEGSSEVSNIAEKLGLIPAHYALFAAEHAHINGLTSDDFNENKFPDVEDNRNHVMTKGLGKLEDLRKSEEDGKVVYRVLYKDAVTAADSDLKISSVFNDILDTTVNMSYGMRELFQRQMGEFFFTDIVQGLKKEKGRFGALFATGKDIVNRDGEASSIFHKLCDAIKIYEEAQAEGGSDYLTIARERILDNNMALIDGRVNLLDYRGNISAKEEATTYQMHIVPLINKVLSFVQELKPHFKDGQMVDAKYSSKELLGRKEYIGDILLPEMVEKIGAINNSDDYSPDMIMHISKMQPVRALTSRNDIIRGFEDETALAKQEGETNTHAPSELAGELSIRETDLNALGIVFSELASVYSDVGELGEEDVLKVQLNEINNHGSEILEALTLELDDVAEDVEGVSGTQMTEMLFRSLSEHYQNRHEGKRVIGAADEDKTADLISKQSRQGGLKQDVDMQLKTFGLHAELAQSVFAWYDAALGSFRHEVSKAIKVPLLSMLKEKGTQLSSNYFNLESGKGIDYICDSIAKRVAFCPISEDNFVNLSDVYNAFLEETHGEMEHSKSELDSLKKQLVQVPPTLNPAPIDGAEDGQSFEQLGPNPEPLKNTEEESGLLGPEVVSSLGDKVEGQETPDNLGETSVVNLGTGGISPIGETTDGPEATAATQFVTPDDLNLGNDAGTDVDDGVEIDDNVEVGDGIGSDNKVEVEDNSVSEPPRRTSYSIPPPSDMEGKKQTLIDSISEVSNAEGDQVSFAINDGLSILVPAEKLYNLTQAWDPNNAENLRELLGAGFEKYHTQIEDMKKDLRNTKLEREGAVRARTEAEANLTTVKVNDIPDAKRRGLLKGLGIGGGIALLVGALGFGGGSLWGSDEERPSIEQVMSKYKLEPQFKQALNERYKAMMNEDATYSRRAMFGFLRHESEKKKEMAAREVDDIAQLIAYGLQPEFKNLKDAKDLFEDRCNTEGSENLETYANEAKLYAAKLGQEESIADTILGRDKSGKLYITETVMSNLDERSQGYQTLANTMNGNAGYCRGYTSGQDEKECPTDVCSGEGYTCTAPVEEEPVQTVVQQPRKKRSNKSTSRQREKRQKAPKKHKSRFRRTRIVTSENK